MKGCNIFIYLPQKQTNGQHTIKQQQETTCCYQMCNNSNNCTIKWGMTIHQTTVKIGKIDQFMT